MDEDSFIQVDGILIEFEGALFSRFGSFVMTLPIFDDGTSEDFLNKIKQIDGKHRRKGSQKSLNQHRQWGSSKG